MFVHAPGLKVVMPFEPADFKGLLKAAIRDDNPVVFFTDLALLYQECEVPDDIHHLVPIGKAAVRQAGSDVTLVSYAKNRGGVPAGGAATPGATDFGGGVDLRSLKPLDEETVLQPLRKNGRSSSSTKPTDSAASRRNWRRSPSRKHLLPCSLFLGNSRIAMRVGATPLIRFLPRADSASLGARAI